MIECDTTIRFDSNNPDLLSYDNIPWKLGEKHDVEFYPNFISSVLLTSTDDINLQMHLDIYDSTELIALDLEWNEEVCLFQFCSSKGTLIIRHPKGEGNEILKKFLMSHVFYGKGNSSDHEKLKQKFGEEFTINLEDIEITRLLPYNHSTNFIQMSEQFAGESTAKFKDKEMTYSDWEAEPLSKRQIFYAAFDVVALFKCYPNFPPLSNKILLKQKNKKKKIKMDKETKAEYELQHKFPIVIPMTIEKQIYCYIFRNYKSTKMNLIDIKTYILVELFRAEDSYMNENKIIEFVSIFNNVDVLVSLFSPIDKSMIDYQRIIEIPPFNFSHLVTTNNILFIDNIPQNLFNENEFNKFLNLFGYDHKFSFINSSFAQIELRNAYSTLRILRFLPFIRINNTQLYIHWFPLFFPALLIKSENNINNEVSFFNQRFSFSLNSFEDKSLMKFKNTIDCDQAFKALIDKGFNVTRYTTEEHMIYISSFELFYKITEDMNISELYSIFSKYGIIYGISIQPKLSVGRIQYITKYDAINAAKNTNAMFLENGVSIKVRNLAVDVTLNEVYEMCKMYGTILNIDYEKKPKNNSFQSVAYSVIVTYESDAEAEDAKYALDKKIINDRIIRVDFHKINNFFAIKENPKKESSSISNPEWKIQQYAQWIKSKDPISNEFEFFDRIIYSRKIDNTLFYLFDNDESCKIALSNNDLFEKPTYEEFLTLLNPQVYNIESNADSDKTEKSENKISDQIPNHLNRKVVIIDPTPISLTTEIIDEISFEWRKLITGIQNIPSIKNIGQQRTVVYSGGKKRDEMIVNLINQLAEKHGEKWNVQTRVFMSKKDPLPPPPPKKARRWVIIDPLPNEMTTEDITEMCKNNLPFEIRIEPSATIKGRKRAVVIKEMTARVVYWDLYEKMFKGEMLNVIKTPPENAPKPLI